MPSNKDLTDTILKLDPKAAVDGLRNHELEGLLSALKAPAVSNDPVVSQSSEPAVDFAAEAAKTAGDAEVKRLAKIQKESEEQAKQQAAANAAAEAATKGDASHRLVEGKAVTCLRGVVASDQPEHEGGGRVGARDFHQGDVDVDRLVAAGVLVKL